jgi:hypothetical protein
VGIVRSRTKATEFRFSLGTDDSGLSAVGYFVLRRCQYLNYIALNGRTTDELERIGKE